MEGGHKQNGWHKQLHMDEEAPQPGYGLDSQFSRTMNIMQCHSFYDCGLHYLTHS